MNLSMASSDIFAFIFLLRKFPKTARFYGNWVREDEGE